ncbi:MAG TPA: TerB family tellurite resistance protein, partial [Salinimicrobium sp.]|nr:TerB family tellurite resistance protein [Salinimicrobium sp.]
MVKWLAAVIGYFFYGFRGAILGFIVGSLIDVMTSSSSKARFSVFQEGQNVSPGDFELNLLSLSAIVIKADSKVSQAEMDYVRSYFVSAYGKERANAVFRTFNEIIRERELSAERIAKYLAVRTQYPARLQITHFLFSIANADNHVSEAEARKIQEIASYLRIALKDFESIKAMFFKSVGN